MESEINILKDFFEDKQLLFNESMKNHTSFKIGGNADLIILPKSTEEIKFIIKYCKDNNINYYVIGRGTNILVKDRGFRGIIIKLSKNFDNVEVEENYIKAKAGATLSKIAKIALANSLSGIEFAAGIPGTIGGGVCMNAGAYGGELKDIVKSVTVFHNNKVIELDNSLCDFKYRNSNMLKNKMIVLEVVLLLKRGNKDEIISKMKEFDDLRTSKQPLKYPSAGSVFKRPVNNYAGKLIREAGFKGKCIGGACVSEKHCGFIVNKGSATCSNVLNLIDEIEKEVEKIFKIKLEKEIRVIGED